MNAAHALKQARRQAGMSQAELAGRAATSQATISAYESGAKEPSISTLERVLAATGNRLEVRSRSRARQPSRAEMERRGGVLAQVLGLAEALPGRRRATLEYPKLVPLSLGGPEYRPS